MIPETSQAILAGRTRGEGHEALFRLIRDHHYLRRWHGRGYRSIELDGYSYWIMEDGTYINRKPVKRAGWDDLRF